jgi:hypothetical protein
VIISNSTISGNTGEIGGFTGNVGGAAGGIAFTSGTLTISNSTVNGNRVPDGPHGPSATAGGIANVAGPGYDATILLLNSTIANNTASGYGGTGPQLFRSWAQIS